MSLESAGNSRRPSLIEDTNLLIDHSKKIKELANTLHAGLYGPSPVLTKKPQDPENQLGLFPRVYQNLEELEENLREIEEILEEIHRGLPE